jgi:AcrR family transcriptional regulator
VATGLFLERGFDDVTIAEVAAAAGVSKVTVFAHFERKEDLMLDRLPDAVTVVREQIRGRADGVRVVEAFRRAALDLAARRHALSGLGEEAGPFLSTVMRSPALISRLRAFEHEIESELATALDGDPRFTGDSRLVAALLIAAYRTVAVETVRRRLAGEDLTAITATHPQRLEDAFDVLAGGLAV